MNHLARAHAAVVAGARDDAKLALIEAWRERRSPVLADLVALLDARAPDAVSAQLAAIVTPRVATSVAGWKKLDRLDDPRVAGRALEMLANPPFTAPSALPFLDVLVATIARLRDPRAIDRAAAIQDAIATRITRQSVRDGVLARFDKLLARLPAVKPATRAELALEANLATALDSLRSTERSEAALLAEIYAHPEDDGPRLVYADVLLEQGDPRGELIALQIERARQTPEPPAGKRELELLKKHGKQWLGSLAPVLLWGQSFSRTGFRRGFVSHAHLQGSIRKKLKAVMSDPAWATIESFDRVDGADAGLLRTAPLRGLRELELDDDDLFEHLAVLPSVRRLILRGAEPSARLRKFFPNLDTVETYPGEFARDQLPELIAMGAKHVIAHHAGLDAREVPAAKRAFKRVVDGLLGTPAEIARLTFDGPGKALVLERGRDGKWIRAE